MIDGFVRRAGKFSVALILAVICPVVEAETPAGETYCAPVTGSREGLNDYRLRNTTQQLRWAYADNKQHHMDVDVGRMRAGEHSQRVMGGLDYTLTRWPNHLPALSALIEYDLAGGKAYGYPAAACYFARARAFAPDDADVLLAEAYWYRKKGDTGRALALYEQSLTISPRSAEAHYNLGLLYFDLSKYEEALKHAWAAYAAGHPLPGLRRKLQSAGHWREPPAPIVKSDDPAG